MCSGNSKEARIARGGNEDGGSKRRRAKHAGLCRLA